MEAKIATELGSSDDLPEQLEVVNGKLVLIGTDETPTFPGMDGKATLIPRDEAVRLMDIKSQYNVLIIFLREAYPELFGKSETHYAVVEKDAPPPPKGE